MILKPYIKKNVATLFSELVRKARNEMHLEKLFLFPVHAVMSVLTQI